MDTAGILKLLADAGHGAHAGDAAADFELGDCNKLFFVMRQAELAARDSTRVRVYSQLG